MKSGQNEEEIRDLQNVVGMTRGFSLFFVVFVIILLIVGSWASLPIPIVGVVINIVFWRHYVRQLAKLSSEV